MHWTLIYQIGCLKASGVLGCLLNTAVANNVLDSLLTAKSKFVGPKTNCFSRPWQQYEECLFRYLRSFPNSLAEGVLLWSGFKMAGMGSKGQYCEGLDLEEWLMERSSTGKACVLALVLGWMDKKRPLAEKGERWLIMWNWEETHYSYAISRWFSFSLRRHLLLVVPLAFAAHAVFWIEVLNNYFSAWLGKLNLAS